MTVINPSSISGITSITMPSGDGNVLTIHTNDGTERFRIDSSGNVKVGSACTISQDGDVFFTGVCTATTLTGAASGLTGALPAIDGSALTGMASTENVRTGILDVAGVSTFRNTMNVGAAVTISESGIEASGIGITCANINGTQLGGRRNIIINGAMEVAQRGTTETGSAANGYSTVDRIQLQQGGTDDYPETAQGDVASGTTPYTEGFRKTFKVTNGNQSTGGQAGDELAIRYSIEAQDVAKCGWNYKSASSFITLSFWVKSSVAQNFYGYLLSLDGTMQRYAFETGSLSADTWTKVTKTIPGNSNIAIDNNNDEGFRIEWRLYAGTDYTDSGVSLNTWAAFAGGTRTPDSTSTWYTTNDATFELTGLQLEVGSQATPFEHCSYGDELRRCQRYYFKFLEGTQKEIASAWYFTSSHASFFFRFPVPMRAVPTGTDTTGTDYYTIYRNGGADGVNSIAFENGSTEQYSAYNSSQASGTAGQCGLIRSTNASAKIEFSAEL